MNMLPSRKIYKQENIILNKQYKILAIVYSIAIASVNLYAFEI